jgi:hypothetical protein
MSAHGQTHGRLGVMTLTITAAVSLTACPGLLPEGPLFSVRAFDGGPVPNTAVVVVRDETAQVTGVEGATHVERGAPVAQALVECVPATRCSAGKTDAQGSFVSRLDGSQPLLVRVMQPKSRGAP